MLKPRSIRYFRLTLQESELLRNKKRESKGTLPCHIVNVALGIEKTVNSSYTSRQGGCLFLCRHHFFYLPMPAQKILISWHITVFAVHGFCGDLVFLCSYPTMGHVNFLFFTFTQKVIVHVTKYLFIFFYFKAPHLLTNIFHYASPLLGLFPNTSLVAADVSPHVTVRRSEIYFLPSDVH